MSSIKSPDIIRIIDRAGCVLYQCKAPSFKQAISNAIANNIAIINVDLSYQDLSFAEFDDGIFDNVSFQGANLTGANLSEARLKSCDFSQSCMVASCVAYSHVADCQFLFAEFAATDFTAAQLTSCMFSGPAVFNVDFSNIDLAEGSYLFDDQHEQNMSLHPDLLRLSVGKYRYIANDENFYVNGTIKRTKNGFFGYLQRNLTGCKAI